MKNAVAFAVGLLFAAGLIVSEMTNPARVIGFLDVAGGWDPSLALVMGSALAVMFPVWRWVDGRGRRPLLAPAFPARSTARVDRRLLGGAVVFGLGWGIAGFCPGPALVALGSGAGAALVFAPAMLVGLALGARTEA